MKIIDNFISDPKVLASINTSPFWEDDAYYWNEFKWNQSYQSMQDSKPTIGSYIVAKMMEESWLTEEYPFYSASGYEYWPTVLVKGMSTEEELDGTYSLNIHTDFDVVAYKTTGELKYPLFGAIMYFGNEDVKGGELRVWENNDDEYQTVLPKNNRLVVFNSHRPHGVTEVTEGVRKSIAINFWRDAIMLPKEGDLV